jgi:hypothetical protein
MQLVLVAVGSVCVLLGLLLFAALRIRLDGRAVGHPNGQWGLAFGLELGPVQVTGIVAKGAPTRLDGVVFGRRFALGRLLSRKRPRALPLKTPKNRTKPERAGFPSWLDPIDAALFVLDERRHLRVEELVLDIDYGFRDVALTGRMAAALYVLSGVLPSRVTLNHNPSWQGGESWQLHVAGRLAVWPGLVVAEVLWYIIRARLRRRPPRPLAPPVRGTAA